MRDYINILAFVGTLFFLLAIIKSVVKSNHLFEIKCLLAASVMFLAAIYLRLI